MAANGTGCVDIWRGGRYWHYLAQLSVNTLRAGPFCPRSQHLKNFTSDHKVANRRRTPLVVLFVVTETRREPGGKKGGIRKPRTCVALMVHGGIPYGSMERV